MSDGQHAGATPPSDAVAEPPPRAPAADGRRPYRAPALRHLGSVRELTLGGTFGVVEGAGTFAMRM